MQPFTNILIGIDLSAGSWFVSDELSPSTESVVDRSLWLAKQHGARLTFLHVLEPHASQMCAERQILLEENHGQRTVEDHAAEILTRLVDRAKADGVAATCEVAFGKSWVEIIRKVLRNNHNLVMVGAHHTEKTAGVWMGSTSLKLLRKCPCPVWVAQPPHPRSQQRILVATDFSPVCDFALQLAALQSEYASAELHVLHVVDPKLKHYAEQAQGNDRELIESLRGRMLTKAERQLDEQVKRSPVASLLRHPAVHLLEGDSASVIQEQIQQLEIELLVMGTIARGGVPGIFVGNTAEKLLPQVSCSLLAVKPRDFVSPVKIA